MASLIQGRIYKITSPNTDKVYIGSTTLELKERLSYHIKDMKKNSITSIFILEKGDYTIELLEEVYVESIRDMRKIEQDWIDETPNTVNKQRAYRTKEQKKEYHREHDRERNKRKTFCKVCNVWITGHGGKLTQHERSMRHIRNFILS